MKSTYKIIPAIYYIFAATLVSMPFSMAGVARLGDHGFLYHTSLIFLSYARAPSIDNTEATKIKTRTTTYILVVHFRCSSNPIQFTSDETNKFCRSFQPKVAPWRAN